MLKKAGSDNAGVAQAATDFLNKLDGPKPSRAPTPKRPERKRSPEADGETA
jgi:hypothetical protein